MINLSETTLINSFCKICFVYNIYPDEVLYHYAECLSPRHFISHVPGSNYDLAAKIFLDFKTGHQLQVQVHENQRLKTISYFKTIMRIINTEVDKQMKEQKYNELVCDWYNQNNYPEGCRQLSLCDDIEFSVPKGFILLCDLYKCSPKNVLIHFIEKAVNAQSVNDPASIFLLHCIALVNKVQDN